MAHVTSVDKHDTVSQKVPTREDPHATRAVGREQRRLEVFVGRWRVEGQNSGSPAAPYEDVTGEESYGWLPGGFFLVGRFDRQTASGEHRGLSILGYDPDPREYFAQNFDNLGYPRRYHLEPRGNEWTFVGRFERATMRFADNGEAFTATWEMSKDGATWQPLCELRGIKLG
jgi:hypothetical protein